jgi:hypothetical protein
MRTSGGVDPTRRDDAHRTNPITRRRSIHD